MSDRLLAAALAYAERLGWPVFPLHGKVPAIPRGRGGRGCHDATTDLQMIAAWWREFPHANVGIATGAPSGFWVLDVDPRHGGDASLAELEQQYGPLPETVEQITGSDGRHLLFRDIPERPVRNHAGIRPGLDSRGTGGYVVAAPSLHPATGRAYAWRSDRRPMRQPIANAPDWLLTLVARPVNETPATRAATPAVDGDAWGPAPRYSRFALERACETIARAPIGQQDATLVREAFSIGTLIASGHMPASLAADALVWAGNRMQSDPRRRPWRHSEIREKVARAFARAASSPRQPKDQSA